MQLSNSSVAWAADMFMDNDFPTTMANGGGLGFLQQYLRGFEDYSQAGTDIPERRQQLKYEQEGGGPFYGEQMISATPSFSIPQGSGSLGKRSGEQLQRIQESGIQNEQLQQELQRRGILSRGVQLPPV